MSGKNSTLRGENFKPFFRPGFIIAGFFIFLFLVLAPFSLNLKSISLTRAETQIDSQYINADTTWTLAGSPYLINADYLFISAVLTIEPGVIIKLSKNNIIVNASGQLIAQGEEGSPIIFTSINDDSAGGKTVYWSTGSPAPGDWGSIQIRGGRAVLDNAKISYGGEICIYEIGSKPVKLQVANAGWCYDVAVFSGQGDIVISNSEIFSNKIGLEFYEEGPTISNSKIYNNQGGGLSYYGDGQLKAINNWWGDDSGPYHETLNPQGLGDSITGNVLFDPWTGKSVAPKKNPVIIVPGIMGSELYDEVPDIIWIDPIDYINDPFDLKLDSLKMDDEGNSKIKLIAKDVVRSIYGNDFYGGLINHLKDNGYVEGKDLFVFPYDWRLDLDQVAGDNSPCEATTTLKCLIEEVKRKTNSDKVDIVAHSMGGLVVKDYVAKFNQDFIDKFIDIATPHLGTPLAAKILNYGDELGFKFVGVGVLNAGKIKDISQNMPAIYQLLPSDKYFNLSGGEYGYYVENSLATNLNLPTGELNYFDSFQFLSKTGNNNRSYLLNKNSLLHAQIDNVKIANSYNISGCGMATIGKIKSVGKKSFLRSKYGIEYIDGDNTVPLRSADYYGDIDRKYYLKGGGHSEIPGNEAVKEFVGLVLAGKENDFNFLSHNNFSQSDDICGISGYELSFHCPADMHIYDNQGNHTGPSVNGDIENNIPGVQYDIIDGNKFVFLPQGKNYKIVGEATGTGTLEIAVNMIANNEYTKTTYFNSIPLLSSLTNVELNLSANQTNISVKVDKNGDGVFEEEKTPDSILTGEEMNDLVKPITNISLSGTNRGNGYYISDVKINLMAADDNSGILKTEHSLDGGSNWIKYTGEFTVSQDGTTTILYSSTDKAGNREENKTAVVKIDKTKPIIGVLLPQENQEISRDEKLNIEYFATDNFSGVATATAKIYLDGQIISSNTIDLFKQNIGAHQTKIAIQDLAGNQAEQIVNFSVITDIDGTIADVNRAYDEKKIAKIEIKKDLINDLTEIKNFQERYGQRIDKEKAMRDKAMAQCLKHENQAWCNKKIGTIFDRFEYQLNKINQAVIKLKYNLITAKLDLYLCAKWINQVGYSIIKEDIRYLISKL